MQRILVVAFLAILFSCSKPDNGSPDDPGAPGATLKITEISPETGNPHTIMVIISGTGFNATVAGNEVLFDNLAATIKTASITNLVIELPLAITEGIYDVTVKANGKTATKADGFRYVTGDLEIVTVTPEKAFPNTTTITITGKGFSELPANNEVWIGNMAATVTTASTGQLVVNLPANITTGTYDVKVKANGKTAVKANAIQYDNTVVTTFAGSGISGSADGMGVQAQFSAPTGIALDANHNLYVSDLYRIRKITPGGQVTTYAGSGIKGADDGNAANARFNLPASIAIDQAGNLYVADQFNHSIRKISINGNVTTIAGNSTPGSNNGIGANASFSLPYGVAVNSQGTVLYVGDNGNHRIRKINLLTNEVTHYAGDGSNSSKDGQLLEAGIPWPGGLHLAADGTLYVTEKGAGRIRKISSTGAVTTIGGYLSVNTVPSQVVVDKDENTYVVYKRSNHVKKYTKAGVESVLFGNGLAGDANGPASQSSFFTPEGITLIEENDGKKIFYISDTGNKKIKKIILNN